MEYQIASGPNIYKLQATVRNLLKDGWHPLGGVSAGVTCLYQAMVREKENIIVHDEEPS